jgi:tetratricopeptide (TPR) repeat protein
MTGVHIVMADGSRSTMPMMHRCKTAGAAGVILAAILIGGLPAGTAAETLARQWAWCRQDDAERQIQGCSVVIRIGRDTPERLARAFANRGRAWSDKGQYDRAVEDLDNAVRLDPNFADAFNYRGVARVAQGQYEQAVQDFGQAIKIDPNYAIAIYNRGLALQTLGRKDAAAKDFAAAKQVGPRVTSPNE